MMGREMDPVELVKWCEVFDSGAWRRLDDEESINKYVDDWVALDKLAADMAEHNFGFLASFRFNRGGVSANYECLLPRHLDPLFHSIMASNYATLNELRTVYSLEDAFLMLDSITTTKINEKRAMDAAKTP
jgi:hypothetical protein